MTTPAVHTLTAWTPSPAAHRGLLVGALALTLGVLTRRPAVVLLGAPLLLWSLQATRGWRGGAARWWVQVGPRPTEHGRGLTIRTVAELPPGCQLAVLRLTESGGIRIRAVARPPGGVFEHLALIDPTGWGPIRVAQTDLLLCGTGGLLVAGPAQGPQVSTLVLPERDPGARDALRATPLRAVGRHRRRAAGHSPEPFDLRAYHPGDPLRWVDPRASSRRRARLAPGTPITDELVVRRRSAESDADLILLCDARSDLVADLSRWDSIRDLDDLSGRQLQRHGYRAGTAVEGGTLDIIVRTAAALAAAYLEAGDRVAVGNLAEPRRGLLTASGPGQLVRIEHLLAQLRTDRLMLFRAGALTPAFEPLIGQWSPDASVVLLCPLLDDDVVDLAVHLRRRGHPLVVVDVTPALLPTAAESSRTAALLVGVERQSRLDRLHQVGAAIVPADPTRVALALKAMAPVAGWQAARRPARRVR